MQPKLVIFDLDGTLVDGARAAIPAMQHAFDAVGLPQPNDAQVMDMIGLSITPAVKHIVNSFNEIRAVSDSEVEQIGDIYKNYFYHSRIAEKHPMPLYDGTLKALAELQTKDEILLAIATGNSRRGVNAFLDKHNLRGTFFTTQCASECPSKPHPEMILQAIRDTGVEAAQTIMIGDTSFDMQMAKAANVYAIGVNWGYHTQDVIQQAGADIIVDDFEQLTSHIFRHLNVN